MKALVCWFLILSLASAHLAAQPAPDAKHAQKIKARAFDALDHHRFVAVETKDRRSFQGLVSETQADGFVLALQGQTSTLTYAKVERITWQRHMPRPVVAALVGATVAAALFGLVHLLLARNG